MKTAGQAVGAACLKPAMARAHNVVRPIAGVRDRRLRPAQAADVAVGLSVADVFKRVAIAAGPSVSTPSGLGVEAVRG